MRLIQPKPDHSTRVTGPARKVVTEMPVYHVRYRAPHHAGASGYDRLCDFVGEPVQMSELTYWVGETLLRPYCLWEAKKGGHYEYSRYDCIMELEVLRHFVRHRDSVYHFVYAEKSFKRMANWAHFRNNRLVGTIHHPYEHMAWLFRSGLEHFKAFDQLIVMSPDIVRHWESVTGRRNVWFVPHGVDTEYFQMGVKGAGGWRRCVFVGSHERDFASLSEIVPRLLSKCPNVVVDLVSPDRRCKELAMQEARCDWHRGLKDAEYQALLGASDILLLPLIRSTTCNAALEAMASGMVVVSNKGGVEAYTAPNCSKVVNVGDVDAFVHATVEILGDDRALGEMQKMSRERALLFGWEKVARQTANVYEAALS